MRSVTRRERIYQGDLIGPDDGKIIGEVWSNGEVAIVFRSPHNQVVATLRDPVTAIVDGHLTVSGTNDESGQQETFTARPPENVILNWVNVNVKWPDGKTYEGATVTATNYKVTIKKVGEDTVELVGATATQQFGRRQIVSGDLTLIVTAKGGCGCGGKR